MPDANDMELVRDYARQSSESAFAELVRRHINLVYSVAVRFTGNPGDAEDVTQAVFILLAGKAAGLSDRTVLTGWLYETTRLTAAGFLRGQKRRRIWEQEACMQSNLNAPDSGQLWRQLAPHLEAAMSRLGERDRTLLALRFYENKTGAEAAAMMGIGAEAAHKRTARALEKLRSFFAKRGVDSTAAAIAENISANSIQVAPVALAKSVTVVAMAKGAAASASTLTLINGALKIMAWTKAKTAIVISASIVFAAGTTTVVIEKSRAERVSGLFDQSYKSALDVLNVQVNKTRRELPPGLTNEFEQSLAARLKTIQEGVSQNISTEYKSAMMAKRILELSEHVMTLPYRKIPVDVQQRKEAQQQYAAVLDRFEKGVPDKTRQLDELSRTAIREALRPVLTDVQRDIFEPGYGRPLNDQEKVELNRIVDGVLQAAAGLPKASDKNGTQAAGLRDAANTANDGRKRLLDFLRNRETDLATNSSYVVAIKKWSSDISPIEKAIDRDLETAERVEINAVIERARQQGEKDIRENNPTNIAAHAQATVKGK